MVSNDTIEIMMDSWAPASRAQYECYISRWLDYCAKLEVDPLNASVEQAIEFLTFLVKSTDLRYSAINTARSALSSLLPRRNGISFGKDHRVSRLLKAIFRLRPSLPKHTVTWDVSLALNCLMNLHRQGDNSLKIQSLKLALLLCLLSGQRCQTLGKLDLEFMYLDNSRAVFYIPDLVKTSRPSFHQAPLEFKAFPYNPVLCPVRCIQSYLQSTNRWEKESRVGLLFLSYAPPFKPIKAGTIARYVRELLLKAEVDLTTFSAHSCRGASTSAAKKNGLSMAAICKAAGWSNCATFAKHYDREVSHNFGETILKSATSLEITETTVMEIHHDHAYSML